MSTGLDKSEMSKKPTVSQTPSESRLAGAGGVRTRFAPSPTGYMHVGGVRTALFAWLLARQNGGQFILRIEDTDQAREVEGSIQHIIESLDWLGLNYDEGPFKQSNRLDIYKKWAQKLLEDGRAYVDPFTSEEVQKFREQDQVAKKPFLYRNHVSREQRNNHDWDGTKPIRFKSDPKNYSWEDLVYGGCRNSLETIDDFILIKSDGFPTYNFAHIIDDNEMGITHVIRGQEFLSSMPNYLNLYKALSFEIPKFAHLPHIMNEQGNKKLSKRDGAKDILDYKKEGYLPDAMLNFLASLGWNDGTQQEVFSVDELIQKFSLSRVQKSGARFDEKRLIWLNGAHIRAMEIDDLYEQSKDYWPESAKDSKDSYKRAILGLIQERLKMYSEIPELTDFFFCDLPINPELISGNKQLSNFEPSKLKNLLISSKEALEKTDWYVDEIRDCLNKLLDQNQQKPGVLFSLIRIATTQSPASPSLAETMQLLGKEKSLTRIQQQIDALN